jgi:hypothetical protein
MTTRQVHSCRMFFRPSISLTGAIVYLTRRGVGLVRGNCQLITGRKTEEGTEMKNWIICSAGSALLISGCMASTIPSTSKMNDAVMMGIKTSPIKTVAYEYNSQVPDGLLKPCAKDSRDIKTSHQGYSHNQSVTLDKMVRDYVAMKFTGVDAASDTRVKVILKDFWLEEYSPDSGGKQFFAVMAGGEINMTVVANMDLTFEVEKAGVPASKVVRISADSSHVSGFGTRTSTSNVNRGSDSIQYRVADAINSANNKALIMLNQFLESNQI